LKPDYNSIIDFLEEEHQKREVFTTAVEAKESANISLSKSVSHVSHAVSVADESVFSYTRKKASHFEEFSNLSDTKELH
jgi:hypothetical protein